MMLDEELKTVIYDTRDLYVHVVRHMNFFDITKLVYSINF